MLRIYTDSIAVARAAGAVAKRIARHDRDLARQLRRAAASVPLNLAEGSGVIGANRTVRYGTALGSAREVRACVEVATAMGYVDGFEALDADRLDKVIATLFNLTR